MDKKTTKSLEQKKMKRFHDELVKLCEKHDFSLAGAFVKNGDNQQFAAGFSHVRGNLGTAVAIGGAIGKVQEKFTEDIAKAGISKLKEILNKK